MNRGPLKLSERTDPIYEKRNYRTIAQLIVKALTQNNLLSKVSGFCADNYCNTNFGGRQRKGSNNVYSKLKSLVNQNMIGVGCPPH